MQTNETVEQLTLFDQDLWCGKTCPELSPAQTARTSGRSSRKSSALSTVPVMCLDLSPGAGDLLGLSYWELNSAWLGVSWTLNSGESPKEGVVSSLSQILEDSPQPKYYLSKTACLGILRRAEERGKELPVQLKAALEVQAGISNELPADLPSAFAANQREKVNCREAARDAALGRVRRKKHFSRSVCHSRPKGGKAQSEVQLSQKSGSAAFLKY